MTLQAKLTLGSVVLATLMVGLVSAVELGNEIERQFTETLERATVQRDLVTNLVSQSLNRRRNLKIEDALQDPELQGNLVSIIANSHAILEVAVVNPQNKILLDSDRDRVGATAPPFPDFRPVVTAASWYRKLQILTQRGTHYYQLQEVKLGPSANEPLVSVRVVIEPALIRPDIIPNLQKNAVVAILSVLGAVVVTFLFSAVAFRPLGRIGHMLDLAAKGEYEAEPPPVNESSDELSVMASKVSLLGQRLRGAQFEVSDLRGNIDRLLQDLEDAVFIFDREFRLVFASGSVEKFLGTARAGLAGKTMTAVFPPYTTLGLVIGQASQNGKPIRNRRVPLPPRPESSGALGNVLLSVDVLQSPAGSTAAGAGLLVRLRDPEAQRKIGRELQMADRLSALSRVSGGVAHEVKNPLNAILLHVEVARSKLAHGDTDVEQQMDIVSREILRLDRVVKTFLDFTRPVELTLTNVPFQELVEEIVELARPQAEFSKIRITVQQNVEHGDVRVDRDLLKQAFLNVVVNAIQAMPDGGELRFESSANSDIAEVRISDTGPGIDPSLRDKIFRLYFTTKKDGSGIGLAMTFRIVQLHDGTIDFTSEPGKGTTFSIRLPMAAWTEDAE
jgi:signal transduction histidine kinase